MADSVLEEAISSLNLLTRANAPTTDDLLDLANQWKAFLKPIAHRTYLPADLDRWKLKAEEALSNTDSATRLGILKAVNEDPMLGVMLVILVLPGVMLRRCPFWWGLHFAEQDASGNITVPAANAQNSEPVWKVKSLDPPTATRKYLLFSDVHRDAAIDDKGPFKSGSIDHFKANKGLYKRLLDYAFAHDYTVVEGGDCEELWFVGDTTAYPKTANGDLDVAAKLQLAIDANADIYAKLATLHAAGRYVRIQGNHDSFLKDAALRAKLERAIKGNSAAPFEIYDACLIKGVKTMFENSALDILASLPSVMSAQNVQQAVDRLTKGKLGLDSNDYTDTCQMLVCHGHQFDFWNCPENEMLGMLIANAVGVTADGMMDPLLDARGIALQGNPLIDFGDKLSAMPVFNSWPDKQSSIKFAHDVQHMPSRLRTLSDNVMFYESIPSAWGALGLALNTTVNGQIKTPAQSRADMNALNPFDAYTYIKRHHMNHICLGHTHNPQSQPFMTLGNLNSLVLPFAPVLSALERLFPNLPRPSLKTNYFNTGTAGWMEGVIWAVEIDQTGQARLIYWTTNSIDPEYMDWELQPLDPAMKGLITSALSQALEAGITTIDQAVETIHDKFLGMARSAQGTVEAFEKELEDFLVLPIHMLGGALMKSANDAYEQADKLRRSFSLEELDNKIGQLGSDAADTIKRALDERLAPLRDFAQDVILSIKRRAMHGFPADRKKAIESISIKAPIPAGDQRLVETFRTILTPIVEAKLEPEIGAGRSASAARQAAAFTASIFTNFPRNMPFFTSMDEALNPAMRARNTNTPVLQSFLSTLWMYPLSGTTIDIEVPGFKGVRMGSTFVIADGVVELTILLRPISGPKPPPRNYPSPNNS